MNKEKVTIDRELKLCLLEAMKRGYFTQDDFNLLSIKVGFEPLTIEIIDRTEQVIKI